MSHTKIEDWGLGLTAPLVIAGPCSVETQAQIQSMVEPMKKMREVQLFRGGVWKPRTRPGNFEGLGEKALEWMVDFREASGIPVTVEIGNAQHAEAALKAGIDVLWIGARTTVNPFSVQEIAEVLRGTNVPVMVKNPLNPDLQLWLGALERLEAVGIRKLAAIHRGFADAYDKRFRNKPNWSMAIHLKREWPGMQVINDPSHICGKREMIQEIAQKAMNYGLDGLMIETHPNPDQAWSDAAQQITPARLEEVLASLDYRKVIEDQTSDEHLNQFRWIVDHLDKQLLDLLSERFEVIDQIGEFKRERKLAVFQPDRWQEVMNSRIEEGLKKKMSEKFMKNLLFAIHEESVKRQEFQISKKSTLNNAIS